MIELGRDYDIYLLGNTVKGQLDMRVNKDGLLAFGPAAAVQKFLANFLLTRGTDVTSPSRGTLFMRQLVSGQLRTESQVTMAFATAAHDTLLYLAGIRGVDADPDEEPVAVEVEHVVVAVNSVSVEASLRTAAGRTLNFSVPLSLG
jgi:hypothetical protein